MNLQRQQISRSKWSFSVLLWFCFLSMSHQSFVCPGTYLRHVKCIKAIKCTSKTNSIECNSIPNRKALIVRTVCANFGLNVHTTRFENEVRIYCKSRKNCGRQSDNFEDWRLPYSSFRSWCSNVFKTPVEVSFTFRIVDPSPLRSWMIQDRCRRN